MEKQPRTLNISRLLFERWLVQNGRHEHPPSSSPVGEVAMHMVLKSRKPIEQVLKEALRPQESQGGLIDRIRETGDY